MEPIIKVIFRKEGADVVAFFPEMPGDNSPSTCTCYAHTGQHSIASIEYADRAKPAKPEEYASLKRELEQIGYRLRVVKRFTRADYETRRAAINGLSVPS